MNPVAKQLLVALDSKIEPLMAENKILEVAFGVTDRVASRNSHHGITNLDHPLAVTDQTIFQAGSISKIFTACAAMKLVESDVLDLEIPVIEYVPADSAYSVQ